MHKLTFYPLGNADTTLVELEGGRLLLFDYADERLPDDPEDKRCDLPAKLREALRAHQRDAFDVVSFSHLDEDHYRGCTEFFWFDHAKKYQGQDRARIQELWAPAAMLVEDEVSMEEGKVLQAEVRYRFRQGRGIRIFSRPKQLEAWCTKNGIRLEDRLHLVTDAGQLVPGYQSAAGNGLEVFVHSPHAKRLSDTEVVDRNDCCCIFHLTFGVGESRSRLWLTADAVHEVLSEVVEITRDYKGRQERLDWDVFKIPHHGSYLSLSDERGTAKTEPVENVAWLYESAGQPKSILVCPSNPTPAEGSEEDEGVLPPHRQALAYYAEVANGHDGRLVVTMEHPSTNRPEPLVIEVTRYGVSLRQRAASSAAVIVGASAPRAG